MKRLEIVYDGRHYTLADEDPADLEDRILAILTSGEPQWLTVNQGEGSYREARILITTGVSISITGIDAD